MAGKTTPVLFITANVGSIFEETITRLDPKFVALHCQEVGGKNYEQSMQYVDEFVQLLLASNELRLFDKVRIYLDEDYTSADKFTALGSFYFIHESLTDVLQYDFTSRAFVEVSGTKVFSHDIEKEPTKEKSKFPIEYFPECKWSRKGFLRTRWSINGTTIDLVNIHLFHDASNFVAIESFPSEYSETRRQALVYTLDRFLNGEHLPVPVFLFGDFNFRTDTKAVVNRLSEGLQRTSVEDGGEETTLDFSDDGGRVLCVGKKTFSHQKHQDIFSEKDFEWLRPYDKELDFFSGQLFEFGIAFQPSYPFEEGEAGGRQYMHTRCPAWCDRVLLTKDALSLVSHECNPASVEYGLIGSATCMGDHKPVYLKIEISANVVESIENDLPHSWNPLRESGDAPTVKRVNSASFVESRGRRHDWQNARCNSDVSWNPSVSAAPAASIKKSLLHGSSRIRLVSPADSIRGSLPRLTSHHSSSDEEWFEVVGGDDDVLVIPLDKKIDRESLKCELPVNAKDDKRPQDGAAKEEPSISICKEKKRMSVEGIQVAGCETEAVHQKTATRPNIIVLKTRSLLASLTRRNSTRKDEDAISWETIDLSDPATRAVPKSTPRTGCCILQ